MKTLPMLKAVLLYSFLFFLMHGKCLAQMPGKGPAPQKLYFFSGGVHLNFWAHVGVRSTPVNFHAERLLNEKNALGIGYSYEEYKEFPYFFIFEPRLGDNRHNLRIRYLYFYRGSQKTFTQYIGCSAGLSLWTSVNPANTNAYMPTAQFFYGMKLKLFEHFFFNVEFAAGPPYIVRSGAGAAF